MYGPRVDTCARRRDGSVWCWCDNPADGGKERTKPGLVPGVDGAVQIAIGGKYSCALLKHGEVGSVVSSDNLATVQNLPPAIRIETKGFDTCAVAKDERRYCWGGFSSPAESERHVGVIRAQPFEQMQSKEFVCYYPPSPATRLYGGCALLHRESEVCADKLPRSYDELKSVKQIDLGAYHGCVLLTDGKIICKGYTQFGQLGNGVVHGEWMPE
jgi:hypothetical protein